MARPDQLISIQSIDIRFDKTHRGPRHGALRKALPRAHAFAPPAVSPTGWWHAVTCRAEANYAAQSEYHDLAAMPRVRWPVSLKFEDDACLITLNRSPGKISVSRRGRSLARLPFGQRLKIVFNDVHDGDHQRLYVEQTLRIAIAEHATLDLPLFREIDLRKLLY